MRDELLDLVIAETERLDRIVGNLLSMSRIEAGSLQPEKQAVALDELAAACAHRLDRLFARAPVDLEFPEDLPYADADYSQLDQVMANLLENAARHAPAGSHIHVRGRDAGDDRVEFSVEDEGVGIPTEERSRAFEPFQRGANSTGSGVGLAICRAIVDANGGSISIEDGVTGGARVVVTLPVRHG
jgi:two-component system sensor histidine kinase KdpD